MSPDAEQFSNWLQFDESAQFQSETYEYSVRRPLYAASAILTRRYLSPDRRLLECRASARYPIRKKKEFEIRAETDAKGCLVFQEETDLTTGKRRIWRMESADRLSLEGGHSFTTHNTVQSVIGLIFAITDLLSSAHSIAGAATMAVVGKQVWALRMLPRDRNTTDIHVEVAPLEPRKDEVSIADANWSSAYQLLVEWDQRARVIRAISVALPIIGRVKVQLLKFDRK